jgi:surface carbohydrate biosynthesis protein
LKGIAGKAKTLLEAKKTWRFPKRAPVLIFDGTGEGYIKPYLEGADYEILSLCDSGVNVPLFLLSMLAGRKVMETYRRLFVKSVAPKALVTFIDNSPIFYRLARESKGVKSISIQNGIRSYWSDVFEMLDESSARGERFFSDYFLAFGDDVASAIGKYIDGDKVSIGGFRNNLVKRTKTKRPRTLAYVSQYRDFQGGPIRLGAKNLTFEEFAGKADRLIVSCLSAYARRNGIRLTIISCYNEGTRLHEKETEYFNSLPGGPFEFTSRTWHGGGYDATDEAEVTVSMYSSLGHESAARGNKTAIFSIQTELNGVEGYTFGWPGSPGETGPFWTNRPDPSVFSRILDFLFSIDESRWRKVLADMKYERIMAYDPENIAFQGVLSSCLNHPASTN